MWSVERQPTFRRNMPPFIFNMLVPCVAYSSTRNMEGASSSEISIDFQRTTRRYIPEDRALQNHRCKNLRSYKMCNLAYNFYCLQWFRCLLCRNVKIKIYKAIMLSVVCMGVNLVSDIKGRTYIEQGAEENICTGQG
jgi:hypothetical protein